MIPRALTRRLAGFRRSEDGSGTIEFVLMLPVMFALFMSTFELGMLLTRQVMLDRGIDMAVRAVRIGAMSPVTHDALKAAICENAFMLEDCDSQLKLEMRTANPRAWVPLDDRADCVDRERDEQPPRTFTPGVSNELMILRACILFDPFFPTTGLGAAIPKESGGAYALLSTASYVVEPN
jgi:Flp pilus assembly protein TadG